MGFEQIASLASALMKAVFEIIDALAKAYDKPIEAVRTEALKTVKHADTSAVDLYNEIKKSGG